MQETAGNTYIGSFIWLAAVSIVAGIAGGLAFQVPYEGFNWGWCFLVGALAAVVNAPVVMAFWLFGTFAHQTTSRLERVEAELVTLHGMLTPQPDRGDAP
ncbi:MAG: hypothetical protein CVT64_11275 [Actinobacteria bacterium HGW-Actinobacteria-4]|nr:MAG: hypothetical protein CVT64_11275 [Actinobacteria bacterium HGW-Actinobacteria-4]